MTGLGGGEAARPLDALQIQDELAGTSSGSSVTPNAARKSARSAQETVAAPMFALDALERHEECGHTCQEIILGFVS